jgi:secondary thiamine-phosphate synthase enzyme
MPVHHETIEIRSRGPGTTEITAQVAQALRNSNLSTGVVTVFCQHTSCSLVITENASPEARRDLEGFLSRLAPPDTRFEHTLEGPDDMPSHIKAALTRTSETIPFSDHELLLGTWQGIFLWEHRKHPHTRSVVVSVVGE